MNLPGTAALPVSLEYRDPFTANLSDQPRQHGPGEAPAFRLYPWPAHTVIMAALAAPGPPYFRDGDPSRSCAPQRRRTRSGAAEEEVPPDSGANLAAIRSEAAKISFGVRDVRALRPVAW